MTEPAPEPAEAPARAAMPRKLRASAARTALLAAAAERTGDAPDKPAETAPEAAVAVLEPAPEPQREVTWRPTIGHVAEARIDRWRAAMPAPIPPAQAPCLSDSEMELIMGASQRPPLPSESAYAELLAAAQAQVATALSLIDSRHAALLSRIDARNAQARKEIGTACGRWPTQPGEADAPPLVAAKEQHHEEPSTGPQAWANYGDLEDTTVPEPDCGDVEPPDIPA